MPRPCIVFASRVVADKFKSDIDTALAYPRSNLVMGGGIHGPIGATTDYAKLLKHPTLNQWAFPDEPIVRGKRGSVPVPAGGTQLDLDTDPAWDGATSLPLRKEDTE